MTFRDALDVVNDSTSAFLAEVTGSAAVAGPTPPAPACPPAAADRVGSTRTAGPVHT